MKDIIQSLKAGRKLAQKEIASVQEQIALINQALDILEPKKEVKATPSADQFKDRILEVTKGKSLTAMEIRRAAGYMSHYRVHKYLEELTWSGKLEMKEINGVIHYSKAREELRLIAGQGVSSRKRLKGVS